MEQDPTFSGNAVELSATLVRDNGLDRARQIAMESTISENEQGNLYRLSVWRDVKRLLREWPEQAA